VLLCACRVICAVQQLLRVPSVHPPLHVPALCLCALSCCTDKSGYLIGSIEGRVAVHHVEEANASKNFTFKCHRQVSQRL
jgi:hypothetical protein